MTNNEGLLVVFSGPSGVGKGTVMEEYLRTHPKAVYSISMTTRPMRPGEVDGKNYYFVSRGEFERRIQNGDMLEYAQYHNNYYGTPKDLVLAQLALGYDVILEIEVQGAQKIKEQFPQAVMVFLLPPSMQELYTRLCGRNTDGKEDIEDRLAIARRELKLAYRYDYVIVNDRVEDAIKRLDAVILAAKCERSRMKNIIDEVNCDAETCYVSNH